VLPLSLTVAFVLTAVGRPSGDRRAHAFAIVAVIVIPAVALIAASFDQTFGGRYPQERYLFYFVPLLFAGAAACLYARRPSVLLMLVAAAATSGMVLGTDYVGGIFPAFASPTPFTYGALDYRAFQLGEPLGFDDLSAAVAIAVLSFVAVALLAVLVRVGRPRLAFALLAPALLAWCVALTVYTGPKVLDEHHDFIERTLGLGRPAEARDWIDREVPEGAAVALVPGPVNGRGAEPIEDGLLDQATWWDAEYWNKRVSAAVSVDGDPTLTPFARLDLSVDRRSGELRSKTGPVPARLLLARSDVRFAPLARLLPVDHGDLRLYALGDRRRAAWATTGLLPNGRFERRTPRLTLWAVPGADASARRVALRLDSGTVRPVPVRIDGPGVRVRTRIRTRGGAGATVCVPAGGRVELRIAIPGAARPRVYGIEESAIGPCRPARARRRR
jgi:hypothetical protein